MYRGHSTLRGGSFVATNVVRLLTRHGSTVTWGLLAVVGLLPVGLLSAYSFLITYRSVHETAESTSVMAAQMAGELVSRELENSLSVAAAFGRLPTLVHMIEQHDEEGVRERLKVAVESFPRIDRVSVLDPTGVLWSDYPKAPETLGVSYAHRDYYRGMAKQWNPYVSEVFRRTAAPRPLVVAVSAPIHGSEGKILGGVVCHYPLANLTEWLRQCSIGDQGYVFVLDHNGSVAAHPRVDLSVGLHREYADIAPVQAALQGTGSTLEYVDPTAGRTMIATFRPVPVSGNVWVVVAQQPVDEAYASIRRSGWQLALATGILALAAVGLILVLGRNQRQLERAKFAAETAWHAAESARDAAESASRAKSTFLANMSHEIRTPLNAVIGMTELVLKSTLSIQQREFLTTVRDSGEALLSVINDVLDFSKIEAGKLVLDVGAFDLRESLGDTMKSFALKAHQQGLELACFIHPDVPHMVRGDYGRLRQIVVNLVGNALKFTEQGEVTLEVVRLSHTERDAELHFIVADTGIGIPPEKQAVIFEMFEQADASTTRRHGGTGLGLAIAQRLVRLMDGRIWVESEPGRGSRFHFAVRMELAENEPAEPLPPEPACLHGMRVLAVDDNATNRRILEEILRSWQMVPTVAHNATEAVRLLLDAHREGGAFRLVLTDAHMPRVDGFMLAEQIKQDDALRSTVVMMLTSGDRPEDMQRCEDLGIASYLLKPIKQSELLEAIELALGVTVTKKPSSEPLVLPPLGCLNILLAEDSLVNQKLATLLLKEHGHQVTVANNGREALARIETEQFDLILMDVQMPEMDGLEATEKIRVWERHTASHVPIIAMTAHALKGDRERCLAAGMDAYVAKPIRAEELFQTIASICSSSRPGPAAAPVASETPLNWQRAVEATDGSPEVLRGLVDVALEETPKLLAAVREAVAHADPAGLRHAAHTLKGSIRYFGADRAFDAAVRLERMGLDGLLEGAQEALADLEPEIARLLAALGEFRQRG